MSARDRALEWSYAAAWRLVRLLPQRAIAAAFQAGADRAARKRGPGARRLAANLRQVVGPEMPQDQFDTLVRDALRSYARYWLEAFRLPSKNREQRVASFHLKDGQIEWMREPLSKGTGVLLALAHSGNWDAAGAWVVGNGWGLTTVAERLKPESVYQRFVEYRESLGMEILPLTGGTKSTLGVLTDRLKSGSVVPLLADRDLSDSGVEVEFFGRKTKMPAGPAILAIRTGVPMFVVEIWFEPATAAGRLHPIEIPEPTSGPLSQRVRLVTQRMADAFEASIRRNPQDWHMLARMFIESDPREDIVETAVSSESGGR
jgi:phosphatidylinositol dimannoside acyltransferase